MNERNIIAKLIIFLSFYYIYMCIKQTINTLLNMKSITFDDFKNSIYNAIENRPHTWRKGQACFNFIEYKYHVARKVEFDNDNPVDCFYDDTKIDAFIEQSWKYIKITINELNNIYNK